MRAIAGLSTVVFLLSVGAVYPTKKPPTAVQPTQQHAKVKHVKQVCNDARKGILFYRNNTWQAQDELRQDRFRTRYPERAHGHCEYLRSYVSPLWKDRSADKTALLRNLQLSPRRAICYVFQSYCGQALDVASCESHLDTGAQNGQYLGLFQMGESERALFGHASDALGQAFAAHEYFERSGRDWSPWSCKP